MADKGKDKGKKELKCNIGKLYKIADGKISRQKKHCPKCGAGVFLAEHENRNSCGKCSYTEFKKK